MSVTGKVVHLTTVHHPLDTRIYYKECNSLARAGYEVYLVAPNRGRLADGSSDNITIVPIKHRKNRVLRMLFSTIEAYKKAKELGADYYHFHDPELILVGWLLNKANNHVIYDIHEDYYTGILQKKYLWKPIRKFLAKCFKKFEQLWIKKMHLCLAEKYYQELYPDGKCILNYPLLKNELINSKKYYDKVENELIYTGNVSEVRGAKIHALIPNLDHDVSLYMVGYCPKTLADDMNNIADLNRDRLIIRGVDEFITRNEIDNFYISRSWLAGLALFPPTEHYKRKELTKFFEYMMAGIPIIASNFSSWKHFINTYQCGLLVDPLDSAQIKKAIKYLKEHPDKRIEMAVNGQKAIADQLNWNVEEKKLLNWYKEMANKV
ncbi:glycosyltransferase [Amphibacillus sediminis]|uniref:glycosyltransferase n=1 Tax=Amphibacillus sediminis TaxID=360185 RepID=UPI00083274AB|nr:glycosyltransferase [Amphibacillus sediminis]